MFDVVKDEWNLNPSDFFEYDDENNKLVDDPRFPRQMSNIGYETHNFLQNVGSLQIFLMFYVLRVIFVLILKIFVKLSGGRAHQFYIS